MTFLKQSVRLCLGLLAVVSVMANDTSETGPLTLADVDRAQDVYIDKVQNRIVALSEKPTAKDIKDLWHCINHAKGSVHSPFAPGFQASHEPVSPSTAKTAKPKSSAERQAQLDINEAMTRSLKYVVEAQKAFESGQTNSLTNRLLSASKEWAKIGAVLDSARKRRALSVVAAKGSQALATAASHAKAGSPAQK